MTGDARAVLEAAIKRLVDAAPPLTEDHRRVLRSAGWPPSLHARKAS